MIRAPADDIDTIRRYYDETFIDYRIVWLNPATRAMHFGYWDRTTRTHAESLLRMNDVMADAVGIGDGDYVLDAGCGVGGSSMWLAETRGARTLGISIVESQIERARRYARERSVDDRVRFEVSDYLCTPFPDGVFDVVWAQESLAHATEKRRFFGEAHRLLRPGGRLVVADYFGLRTPAGPVDRALLESWAAGHAITPPPAFAEWERATVSAGFSDVNVTDVSAFVEASVRRLHRLTLGLGPVAAALSMFGLRTATQQANVRAARDIWRAYQRGLWFFGILVATKP